MPPPARPSPEQAADLERALEQLRRRLPDYRLYREYYDGQHRWTYGSETLKDEFGRMLASLSDNLCASVVDAVADRLQIEGITGRDDDPDQAFAKRAWGLWTANRMGRRIGEAHLEAARSGDAYLIVWPAADGQVAIHPQRADRCTVVYSETEPDQVEWGAKIWLTRTQRCRVTLYYKDRIERWVSRNEVQGGTLPDNPDDFQGLVDDDDGGVWPLPNPYGRAPIFHLPNNAALGSFGVSELRPVIPLNDTLNLSIRCMAAALEYVALPQRYAIGVETPETDPTSGATPTRFRPGVDRVWTVNDPNGKFGEFQPADMSGFLSVQESLRSEIARVSGTPMHYLMLQSGVWPSGAAMVTAEARFLSKIDDRQRSFGEVEADTAAFAVAVDAGPGAVPPGLRLTIDWKDPAPRSEQELVDTLVAKHTHLGVPREVIWRELGYSEDEIATMRRLAEEDRRPDDLGQALLQLGRTTTQPPPTSPPPGGSLNGPPPARDAMVAGR